MLASGLTDDGSPVSGAAVLAGVIAATDAARGVWVSPGGPDQPVAGWLVPALAVDDTLAAALNPAGIDPWRVLPGYGTVFFGGRTLAPFGSKDGYIGVQCTQSWITRTIDTALQPYVFAPNTAATWSAVDQSISSFLTSAWQEGALVGPTAGQAFTVDAGLGSTITSDDILDGLMIVSVKVALSTPAEMIALTFQQQMQG